MSKDRDIGPEYLYYGIPSPWLHSKCLRALQWFPPPEIDADRNTLSKMLQALILNWMADWPDGCVGLRGKGSMG
eukprot:364999-Chlamydomonas_euryale.AAC.37